MKKVPSKTNNKSKIVVIENIRKDPARNELSTGSINCRRGNVRTFFTVGEFVNTQKARRKSKDK